MPPKRSRVRVRDENRAPSESDHERNNTTMETTGVGSSSRDPHRRMKAALHKKIIKLMSDYLQDPDKEDACFDDLQTIYKESEKRAFVEAFFRITAVPFNRSNEPGIDDLVHFVFRTMTDMDKEIDPSSEEEELSLIERNKTGVRVTCLRLILKHIDDEKPTARARLVEAARRIMGSFETGLENELEKNLIVKLTNELFNRLDDKIVDVRIEAVLALCCLQSKCVPKKPCPVTERLIFSMRGDASLNVRKTVIENLTFVKEDIEYLACNINDNKAEIRASVYKALVKVPKEFFESSIQDSIITSGLDDTSEIVRKAASKLVEAWFTKCGGRDVFGFLEGLDLVRQRNVIYRILNVIYDNNDEAYDKADWSIFKDKLIPLEEITAEKVFFWRFLIWRFAKTEYSSRITPNIAPMCTYMKKYLEKAGSIPNGTLILLYLMQLTHMLPLEEGGRYILLELLQDLKVSKHLEPMHVKYLVLLHHQASLVDSTQEIIQFAKEIMNGVRENLEETPPVPAEKPEEVVEQPSTELKEAMKLEAGLKMHERFVLVKERDMYRREGMHDQAMFVENKIQVLQARIHHLHQMVGLSRMSRLSRSGKDDKIVDSVVNESNIYPPRALELGFCVVIVYLQTKGRLTGRMVQFAQEFSQDGLKAPSEQTRIRTFEMITLVSLRFEELAEGTMLALVAALLYDDVSVKYTAAACFFDMACRYGFSRFTGERWDKLLQNTRVLVEISHNTDERVPVIVILEYLLQLNEPNILKRTVLGICKLLILGHLSSRKMIEKLLLLWLNPANTYTSIYTDVCTFVAHYTNRGLKQAFMVIDCLIPCCNRAMNCGNDSPLKDANIDKFIEFITHRTDKRSLPLVSDGRRAHVRLVVNILNEMIRVKNQKEASQYAVALKTINLIGLTSLEDTNIRKLVIKAKAGLKGSQVKTSLDAFVRYLDKFEHEDGGADDSLFDLSILASPRPSAGRLSFRPAPPVAAAAATPAAPVASTRIPAAKPVAATAETSTCRSTSSPMTLRRSTRTTRSKKKEDSLVDSESSEDNDTEGMGMGTNVASPDMFD